jgi:hypothetical protein
VVRRHPRILFFLSVFQPQIASLALAPRVKQALPYTFVVIGGANVEGVMAWKLCTSSAFSTLRSASRPAQFTEAH